MVYSLSIMAVALRQEGGSILRTLNIGHASLSSFRDGASSLLLNYLVDA